MNCKGLLVLVLSLGGATGAAVLWTELDEAKVRGETTDPVSERLQPATAFGVFVFADLFEEIRLPERCSRPRRPPIPGAGDGGSQVNTVLVITGWRQGPTGTGNKGAFVKAPTLAPLGSLRVFQKVNDLPPTGEPDEATLEVMRQPRCGLKDPFNKKYLKYRVMGERSDRRRGLLGSSRF